MLSVHAQSCVQALVDRAAPEPERTEGQGGGLETQNGWMHSTYNTTGVPQDHFLGILTPLWTLGKHSCLLLMAAALLSCASHQDFSAHHTEHQTKLLLCKHGITYTICVACMPDSSASTVMCTMMCTMSDG